MTGVGQWDHVVDHTLVGREDWDELPAGPVVVVIELDPPSPARPEPDRET